MSLGIPIADFAALMTLAIAAKRKNWTKTSALCGSVACATLVWGVAARLFL